MKASPAADGSAIAELVDVAIERARCDSLIGPIFERANGRGEGEWTALRSSWIASLAGDTEPLLKPKLEPRAFGRWLAILQGAAAELFEPPTADALSEQAERVAAQREPRLFIGQQATRRH